MPLHTPRATIIALSAALALTAAALTPAAMLAKGTGGNGDCTGDCSATGTEPQQIRARDGSGTGQATETQAQAGGGGQVRARVGDDGQVQTRTGGSAAKAAPSRNTQTTRQTNRNASQARNVTRNGQGRNGAGQGPNEDGQRGPGTCDDCLAEMGTLTEAQEAGLIFMANEEKLAHDVYAAFAEQYGVPIFSNVAESESMHQQAVNVVLERYGLEDTAIGLPAGEFSDPSIASLYATLMEQGSASLEEAIGVGVLIEETDIADLESRLADLITSAPELEASTEDVESSAPDVHQLYSHLRAASQNHLAAFQGWL